MAKQNKYNYYKVIQQNYAGYWEDVSFYECKSTGVPVQFQYNTEKRKRKSLLALDLITYRQLAPTRVIFRKEKI